MAGDVKTAINTDIDWDVIRNEFPVLKQEIHGNPLVYLDNGASSQMPQEVADRIHQYHMNEHSNVHRGIHTLSQRATDAYEETRKKIARLINAESEREVVITTGTTDSINLVAHSYGNRFLNEGDEIIITAMEHHANIVPWQMTCENTGAILKVVPFNEAGELDMEAYHSMLSAKTKIVAFVQISNVLGTVNPAKEIIDAAHEVGAVVLLDAAQSVPHSKIDVQDLDADFLTFSGHKMCGPTGIGILYGKADLLEKMPPYRGGGDMIDRVTFEKTTYNSIPFKFEAGTPPIAAGIGLGAAVDYLMNIGMENIQQREAELLEYATSKLNTIEGLRIVGTAKEKASVISFVVEGIHPTDLGTIIDQKGIAVRTGHHCAQPVMDIYELPGTARASISFYNNEADIDRLVEGIEYAKEFFE